jgi:hypothetical protein
MQREFEKTENARKASQPYFTPTLSLPRLRGREPSLFPLPQREGIEGRGATKVNFRKSIQ